MGRPNLNDKFQTLFMRRRGEVRDLGMLMAGVAVAAVLGWCSLVKLRISSEPRGAAAILRRVFHFYDCMASPNYRVTGQLESYIQLQSIWGVPPACGPLLQLATAQAGYGNFPN